MNVSCQSLFGINSGLKFTKYGAYKGNMTIYDLRITDEKPDFTVGFVYKYGYETLFAFKVNAEYIRKSFSFVYNSTHSYTCLEYTNNDYKSDCIFIKLNSEIGGNLYYSHLNLGFYVGLLLNPKKHTTINYYPLWGPNAPFSHITDSKADELSQVNAGFLLGVGFIIPISSLILITIDSNLEYGLTNIIVEDIYVSHNIVDRVFPIITLDCKVGVVFKFKKDN